MFLTVTVILKSRGKDMNNLLQKQNLHYFNEYDNSMSLWELRMQYESWFSW